MRIRQIVVIVEVEISLQEINVCQCAVKSEIHDCVCVCLCVWATDYSLKALLLTLLEAFLFPVLFSSALSSHPLFLSSLSPLIRFHPRPLIRSLSTIGAKDKCAALGFSACVVWICLCVYFYWKKNPHSIKRSKVYGNRGVPLHLSSRSNWCIFNAVSLNKKIKKNHSFTVFR